MLHKTSKWGVDSEVDFCYLREKEEEGHFGDIDVTQNMEIQGAKREGGQGLRSQIGQAVKRGPPWALGSPGPLQAWPPVRDGRNTGVIWPKTKAHGRR